MKNPFARTPGQQAESARKDPVSGLSLPKTIDSPYLNARREWNERYGSYIQRAQNWRMMAFGSLALSAVLGISLVVVAGQSKVQPFIVEVDKLGQAVAVQPAEAVRELDERIVRAQLSNYIANIRNITPDPTVQKRWLDSVYAMSGAGATSFLNDYFRKNDPFVTGRTSMVTADIEVVLPLSSSTWQVQWTETKRSLSGQVEGVSRWQAVLTTKVYTPTTAKEIAANPTGLVAEQITWTQQL